MRIGKLALTICALAVVLASCAKEEENKAVVPSDGKVEGTLTINGKIFPLKYVYAGRRKDRDQSDRGVLEVLVTNEPLPYETLSRIFLELEVDLLRREEHKVLKGTSVNALFFAIPEYRLEYSDKPPVDFDGMLMTPETVFDYSNLSDAKHEFDEFSLKDGTIAAKAKSTWEQTETGEDFKEIKIAAEYSVRFEAKVSEQSLLSRGLSSENKSWQESLSKLPEEGKAQGTLTVSSRVVNLSFAYAQREKWADSKGEGITLLLTDRPVPKEFLLLSFERGLVSGGYGLRLRINDSGTVQQSFITYTTGQNGMFDPTSTKDFRIEDGRVSGTVENKQRGRDENDPDRDGYSVKFEAPLKK